MEDTHVHALDYVSVVRRRKWWLIVPIVLSMIEDGCNEILAIKGGMYLTASP